MRECAQFGCDRPVLPHPGRGRPATRCQVHRRAERIAPPPAPAENRGEVDFSECPLAHWLDEQKLRFQRNARVFQRKQDMRVLWNQMIDEHDTLKRMR